MSQATSRAMEQLDENQLAQYLEAHVAGFQGPLTAEKFAGGQSNPTFLIKARSGQYVLRRKPPGVLLKSAHAVDREFRVITALRESDVPVAQGYHLCEDDSIIGSMFYLMEYVDGVVHWDARLPEFDRDRRVATYDEMSRVLAALHSVDVNAAGLTDYGRPGNYYQRQLNRWSQQYRASETETIAEMEQLIPWLESHIPEDDGQVSLVHGDYRLDNLIFHRDQPRILAVVDWELSTLGHPFADLAYQCMYWRFPPDALMPGFAGLDRQALGLPTEQEYIDNYCQRRGIDGIDNWTFYMAFCFFRSAAIVQGVKKRALDGNASSNRALKIGELVRPCARMAVDLIDSQ